MAKSINQKPIQFTMQQMKHNSKKNRNLQIEMSIIREEPGRLEGGGGLIG